ncbi:MAG TPA: DUF5995 family protein [Acidobacteriaceae bacterium]|jgi:hypothetical protein
MFPYDPTLLTAVSRVPQTVSDVLETMQTIAGTCVDGDGLKWFNWLYFSVTQAVESQLSTGGYANPEWLAALDVQFARLYFGALQTYLKKQSTPSCWRALFDRRPQVRLTRLQFALAGINAHINHDLAVALVNTCQASGCAPEYGDTNYGDYTKVNTTLNSLIDSTKQELNVRLLGEVLPAANKLEDTLGAFVIAAAREQAWHNCEILWRLQTTPKLATGFMASLDGLTTLSSKAMLVEVP